MKIGSLVEYIGPQLYKAEKHMLPLVNWFPDYNTSYVVRGFADCPVLKGTRIVYLEEGVIGYNEGFEIGIGTEYYRELQPPMDLSELLEETLLQEL